MTIGVHWNRCRQRAPTREVSRKDFILFSAYATCFREPPIKTCLLFCLFRSLSSPQSFWLLLANTETSPEDFQREPHHQEQNLDLPIYETLKLNTICSDWKEISFIVLFQLLWKYQLLVKIPEGISKLNKKYPRLIILGPPICSSQEVDVSVLLHAFTVLHLVFLFLVDAFLSASRCDSTSPVFFNGIFFSNNHHS